MSFTEFQATGRDVALATVEVVAPFVDEQAQGRVYAGDLYIERAATMDGWYLTIGNMSAHFHELADAEKDLYDWACREGYFE